MGGQTGKGASSRPFVPVYFSMADYWERLIEELVLELLQDLLDRPHVWEAEAWLAGVSVEELLEEEIAARVGLVLAAQN